MELTSDINFYFHFSFINFDVNSIEGVENEGRKKYIEGKGNDLGECRRKDSKCCYIKGESSSNATSSGRLSKFYTE